MKVPEVWLYDGKVLQFLVRNRRGKYQPNEQSLAFPYLAPKDIEKYLDQHADIDETSLTHKFVAGARGRKQSWEREQNQVKLPTKKKSKGRNK
jgi:hypothetical protein